MPNKDKDKGTFHAKCTQELDNSLPYVPGLLTALDTVDNTVNTNLRNLHDKY